jgi:predicted secreted Zn-dependent protease
MLLSLQRSLGNQAVGRILRQRGRTGHPLRSGIQRRNGRRRRRANTGTVTIRNVQYQYYNVSGRTLADVHSQLDPTEWGRCSYHYSYTYRTSGGNASRVNITLRLTIRLPRWTGRGWNSASRPAKAEWRRMLRALRTHENGHAAIARRWAPTFKQRMLNQPEGDLEGTFNQVLGEADAEQGQFDTRTSHGQTQGVSLDTSIQ